MKYLFLCLACYFSLNLNGQISQDSLLAYYPFNGDVTDQGPNSFNGNNFGGNFDQDVFGNEISSLSLNGIDEFLDLSVFANVFRDNLQEMSIYFKVKFESEISNQTILSLGTAGENLATNVFEFEYENDRIQLETEVGSDAINSELFLDNPSFYLDYEWHNVLVTLNEEIVSYYRDGQLIYSGIYTPAETGAINLFIGCYNGTGNNACCFFEGQIDELQFYNRILDVEESIVSTTNKSQLENFELVPNPSSGNFNIILSESKSELRCKIFNSNGELIESRNIDNLLNVEIELKQPNGIYFIQLVDSNGVNQTKKLIKQ